MKTAAFIFFLLSFASANAQTTHFDVIYSEPLAVFEFVDNLSSNAGNNGFKKAFDASEFNTGKYQELIRSYDKLTTDYTYEYTAYPYAQKIGGSTLSLLQRNLINCRSVIDFQTTSLGIIPNTDLFVLCNILNEFTPVYRQVIYSHAQDTFQRQLADIRKLIVRKNIAAFFQLGARFYHSSWNKDIPFNIVLYPLPNATGFKATAFYNNAVSGIPTRLTDYNKLLSVILHESFHILFDEQSLDFKNQIAQSFAMSRSENSGYAYLLMNEALATSLGNGYVYGKMTGRNDTAAWYHRKYTNLIAKAIYPIVQDYASHDKQIDQNFISNYIRIYDENFPMWRFELENVMTDRYVLTDNAASFSIIDQKFPYRSMSQYDDNISLSGISKLKQSPITKVVIISKDNQIKLALFKNSFDELKNWQPAANIDFSYAVWLSDKTWLIIVNQVSKPISEILETLHLR